jgi:tRNA splicing endonuclease
MTKPYSHILVALLKGIVYSHNEKVWDELLKPENEADVKKYFADINLDVIIDKSEGFAYLKQKVSEEEEEETPKLIQKRPLNFHVSLLCLLLRKHLIENDREGESSKAILSKEEIISLVKPFYKQTTNEANQQKQIETAITKVIEEGFLRKMKTDDEQFEINRIIKAFVNADVVNDSLEKLKTYTNQISE